MNARGASCCFTGHRPSKLPWGYREDDLRCMDLKMDIVQALVALYARGFRHFLCGMAEGCDLYFAESVLLLREVHDDVRLESVVPFRGQADRWTAEQQQRYKSLLVQADQVTVLQEDYSPGCMMARNRYLVNHASLLLACYNGEAGGTRSTILYARERGLEIQTIPIE